MNTNKEEQQQQTLYLSKDKMFLMDEQGRNISIRITEEHDTYYLAIGIESEAFEKNCIDTKPIKVCTAWNNKHQCSAWSEVYVCTKYELISKGYSNIS